MKKQGRKDVSYWILAFLIALIFILGFLEWCNLELPKARGENIPAAPEKIIILNFDDGPRPSVLKELLPLLKKYNVPAAFFMEGACIAGNETLLKKMTENGFTIENHSWGHEFFVKLLKEKGPTTVRRSIEKTGDAIFKATGRKPKYFRPPYWQINDEVEKIAKDYGYKVMKLNNPDNDTADYSDVSKHRPPEALITRVKKIISSREKQGQFRHILVFHELPITVVALKILIPYFQNQEYQFQHLDKVFLK